MLAAHPPTAVFHTAGVNLGGPVLETEAAVFAEVAAAKAVGARHLDELLGDTRWTRSCSSRRSPGCGQRRAERLRRRQRLSGRAGRGGMPAVSPPSRSPGALGGRRHGARRRHRAAEPTRPGRHAARGGRRRAGDGAGNGAGARRVGDRRRRRPVGTVRALLRRRTPRPLIADLPPREPRSAGRVPLAAAPTAAPTAASEPPPAPPPVTGARARPGSASASRACRPGNARTAYGSWCAARSRPYSGTTRPSPSRATGPSRSWASTR
ncbi:hypothetical protein NKH77_01605 [Streptomyces sp. M19]